MTDQCKPRPLRIVIVGAWIAGLTAALAFGKQGHHVVLDLNPREFGGTVLEKISYHDEDGNMKFCRDFTDVRQMRQAEYYFVHRADLHNALKKRAKRAAEILTGCKIVDVDTSTGHPSVDLDDGRTFEGDVPIGADGFHDLRELSVTQNIVRPGQFAEWATPKSHLVIYPCSDNQILNLCAFLPAARRKMSRSDINVGWGNPGSKDTLTDGFADFCPSVRELVSHAAHPFQPFLGQGGAMAMEDAVSLAVMLPLGTMVQDIPARLRLYETIR
ncbi:hypothetical protein BJX61DRAFT_536110 [Aspergillus egyptiacus]|nr:hypothetical protein BJX61DRAFT_536110 [Aspergillus egyptiacus]